MSDATEPTTALPPIPPGFVRAILDEPGCDLHRLVLADWMEENGYEVGVLRDGGSDSAWLLELGGRRPALSWVPRGRGGWFVIPVGVPEPRPECGYEGHEPDPDDSGANLWCDRQDGDGGRWMCVACERRYRRGRLTGRGT